MRKREARRKMWKAVKAFVADEGYEGIMDDLTVECNDDEWGMLTSWIDIARDVLDMPEVRVSGAAPLPIIIRELERRSYI